MACGPSTGPAGYVPHSDPPGVAGAATDGGAATDAARTVNQAAGAMASQPPPPGSLAAKWLVTRGLNLGDTYSYALAQVTGEPLLFRGDDFTHTDIRPACT